MTVSSFASSARCIANCWLACLLTLACTPVAAGQALANKDGDESAKEARSGSQSRKEGRDLEGDTGVEPAPVYRSNRMEFDARLIKGQTASSGAVYLFTRVPRTLPELVPIRRSYRKRIVEPVLGQRSLEPIQPAEEGATERLETD